MVIKLTLHVYAWEIKFDYMYTLNGAHFQCMYMYTVCAFVCVCACMRVCTRVCAHVYVLVCVCL